MPMFWQAASSSVATSATANLRSTVLIGSPVYGCSFLAALPYTGAGTARMRSVAHWRGRNYSRPGPSTSANHAGQGTHPRHARSDAQPARRAADADAHRRRVLDPAPVPALPRLGNDDRGGDLAADAQGAGSPEAALPRGDGDVGGNAARVRRAAGVDYPDDSRPHGHDHELVEVARHCLDPSAARLGREDSAGRLQDRRE